MVHAHAASEVGRPAAETFTFFADPANNPRWQRGMRACRVTSQGPLGVGSTYEQRARFLGKDVLTSFRVTALEPGRSITYTSTGGSFPITVTRTVEPLGPARARATESVAGDPRGFYRVATPLLGLMVRASMGADHRRLRRLLDAGG